MSARPQTSHPRIWLVSVLLGASIATHPVAAAAAIYNWASAVSGFANDPARWNPIGIPAPGDLLFYSVPGTFNVTFPSTFTAVGEQHLWRSNVTFHFDAPTTSSLLQVGDVLGVTNATIEAGTLTASEIDVGYIGLATATLTLTGGSTNVTSAGIVGDEDTATLDVIGGARLNVSSANFHLGWHPGSNGTLSVSGRDPVSLRYSRVQIPATNTPFEIGRSRTGTLRITNGGSVEADCDIFVGVSTTAHGFVDIGPRGILNAPTYLRGQRRLLIGGNGAAGLSGEAVLSIFDGAFLETAGALEVGDPDGTTAGVKAVLRLFEGSQLTATGGVKFWPTPAALDQPLTLYGGLLHVRGGAFEWPASKMLFISSQVGTPKLWIANGVGNTGPSTLASTSQILIARSGAGELRVTRPGTVFDIGAGTTTVADSASGDGSIVVDSTGTLRSAGPVYIGVRGRGTLEVTRNSVCDIGTLSLGTVAGATGLASIGGSATLLRTRDNVWVGGGLNGAGGSASVVVDAGATLEILHTVGLNPPFVTVFAGGSVTVASDGVVRSVGSISNSGQCELRRGLLDVLSLSQPMSGRLRGWGTIIRSGGSTNLNSSGEIAPFGPSTAFGAIDVAGNLNLFTASHYRVDLGRKSGGRASDTLRVAGAASLNGTLDLVLDPSFVRVPGDTFTVISGGSIAGTFSAVTWNGNPMTGQALVVYRPNAVLVVITNSAVDVEDGPVAGTFRLTSSGGSRLVFTLELPQEAQVELRLFDVAGREVLTMGSGVLSGGVHRFSTTSGFGGEPSGVYFGRATITVAGRRLVRTAKATLVR